MKDWNEITLSDVCILIAGYAFKSKDFGDYPDKVLKIADINPPFVNSDSSVGVDMSKYDKAKLQKYVVRKGDYILAMTGATIGKLGRYTSTNDAYLNQRVLKFEPKDNIDSNFLYYILSSWQFGKYVINHIDSESAQPNISAGTIGQFRFMAPSLAEQKEIGSLLSELDSKIINNRLICDNLEKQAQTLFKHWFIDFAPFKDGKFVESELGMIPEGWRVGTLGNYCKVKSGYAFKSSWWTDRGCKIIKIKNITENGQLDLSDCSYVSPENCAKASAFKAQTGDLIIAMTGATIGKFNIIPKLDVTCYINQRVGKFFLGERPLERLPFIYSLLKSSCIINQIINRGIGSAQPNISGGDIESIQIAYNEKVINSFNAILKELFETFIYKQAESSRLSTLRDTLLPKLMSGQIKV